MNVRGYLLMVVLTGLAVSGCSSPPVEPSADSKAPPHLRGPYLGETPPGETPVLFAPDFISTGLNERDAAWSSNGKELYFSVYLPGFTRSAIVFTREGADGWSRPEVAPFSGQYKDIEPLFSPDGSALYFASDRPMEGGGPATEDMNLWIVKREGDGWAAPAPLPPPVNSPAPEFFPSPTRSGSLYFCREAEDGSTSIYAARKSDGAYLEPERLPDTVNIGRDRFNAFADPDERFILVCAMGGPDSIGGVDYFVSFANGSGGWLPAVNLGEPVNTEGSREYSAYPTPDGKYLFFMSNRTRPSPPGTPERLDYTGLQDALNAPSQGSTDLWWISSEVIFRHAPEHMERSTLEETP